ncbi:MAG: glycine cleavage system protein H [Comamonas sp. SCN 67-35]|uniref:glycine cleavage system protein H n=1 Tax=unclassified Comamonas TaxID=2638500 RepID=UPI0008684544|nr:MULTISPECIES: glycine cleavage system protein H [unclassified Comamonas]MBN9328803.1 glycine cleavage system protein H [Comamonas sp.]ODU38521.1 MAG: glycine cleavage system protein H [Comamonas sp. SCN 67-35]OJX02059.1 MAG: glycine cleavage system protein H [Burkholderiales bacterium 66-26]
MSTPLLRLSHPPELYYLIEHQVWARLEADGASATVGITALGIALSGDIYMCRPKRVGTELAQGATVAVVELSKSIVAVKTAVSGAIIEINERLEERPRLVDQDPYGAGWIARLRLADFAADVPQLVHGDAVHEAMARHARANGVQLAPPAAP